MGLENKISRAEQCGIDLGEAINEMANLMYQNNTKRNFYKGLYSQLYKLEDLKK